MRPFLPLLVAAAFLSGCNGTTDNGPGPTPPDKTMRKVEGGTYKIGTANKARTVSTFWIDKNEVTNEQYHAFLQTEAGRGLTPPQHWKGNAPPEAIRDRPVHYVSYEDAVKFATHHKKQIPTADQWEAAARGKDALWYPWGNSPDDAGTKAQIGFYFDSDDGTAPVGYYSPAGDSHAGCRDMLGNVFEWTKSTKDGNKVVKGGSYLTPESLGDVNLGYDGTADGSSGHEGIGFRCVWTP